MVDEQENKEAGEKGDYETRKPKMADELEM